MSKFACLVILFAGIQPRPAASKTPTVKEWISLKGADAPELSPDGRSVAYHIRSADWDANSFDDEIWIVDIASGKSYQFSDGKGTNWSKSWSPKGPRLAFLSTRDGAPQIYLASPPDRKITKITDAKNGVNDYKWSPDGRHIAYTTSESFAKPEGDEPPEYHIVGNDPPSSVSLWVIGTEDNATAQCLVDGTDIAVEDIAWSPDSRRIAFSASRIKELPSFYTYDIYVIALGEATPRKVVDRNGPDFYPVWSPDGTQIAFRTNVLSANDHPYFYNAGYVAVVSAEGGPSHVLTEKFDESATPIAWSRDGIYFTAKQRTYQHLFRLNPETTTITRITEPYTSVFAAFSFTPDFKETAFMAQDAAHYDEVCFSSVSPFKPRRLTAMGDQLTGSSHGRREVITWKSTDGTPIEGVLIKPENFNPSKKYPLLVILHGGPLDAAQATTTRDLPYPADLLVNKGALVLRPNYRGSTGYGRHFRELLVRNEGKPQCDDVVTGVDHLVNMGIVDPNRVGALGWSAGGYLAAFLTTTTNRFKAITVGEGVSDAVTFYALGGGTQTRPDYARATPWEDPDYYRNISALSFVKNAKTPTLIQHRETDLVAPVLSQQELYKALKDQGVPVKMILYTGSGHLPSGLKQTQAVIEHNMDWMDQWIWRNPSN